MINAFFDLDGVTVDMAMHPYARKRLANSMGLEFSEEDDERLKGVSSIRLLEIVLEIGIYNAILEEKKKHWHSKRTTGYPASPY